MDDETERKTTRRAARSSSKSADWATETGDLARPLSEERRECERR